jgi:general secretion pathway protein G
MNYKSVRSLGFTLIELMVVVAIIGVLMAAGLVAFTNAQQAGRDAKRKADVDGISKALEQYNQANAGLYPTTTQTTSVLTTYFPTGALPTDPKGVAYTVTLSAGGTTYCVCSPILEKVGTGNSTSNACAYAAAGSKDYQCASQRQ